MNNATTRPRVFIPNIPMRRDPVSGRWRPVLFGAAVVEGADGRRTLSIPAAERYGELVVLFEQHEVLAGPGPCDAVVDERLRDARPEDYVVHIGDPTLIAMVARAHARRLPGCRMRQLKWDRRMEAYIVEEVR